MSTAQHDRGLISKSWELTDTAILLCVHTLKLFVCRNKLVVILYAGLIKTADALCLSSESFAWMPTRHNFWATLFHHFNALWLSTHILEGLFVTQRGLCELFPTETTLKGRFEICCLFTSPPKMIGLLFAACTKILSAGRAADSKFGHMLCRCLCEFLAFFVFGVVVNFWILKHNQCTTVASDHVWI